MYNRCVFLSYHIYTVFICLVMSYNFGCNLSSVRLSSSLQCDGNFADPQISSYRWPLPQNDRRSQTEQCQGKPTNSNVNDTPFTVVILEFRYFFIFSAAWGAEG